MGKLPLAIELETVKVLKALPAAHAALAEFKGIASTIPDSLTVFAVKGKTKPLARIPLCHAPYFNMHSSGLVCMGNVRIDIERDACLEDFILQWERYFRWG